MFTKHKPDSEIHCPIIMDSHVTSPGHEPEVNTRREVETIHLSTTSEIFDRARHIYGRAKRGRRRRSAGIL
jgi:hypothetical protein